MRKVMLQEFVSLDARASGPNDSVAFVPASNAGDASFGRHQMQLMDSVDTLLLGRKTYEMFRGYWPNVASDAEDKAFADRINATPKIVFSHTLQSAPWGSFEPARIISGDLSAEVAKLTGRILIWGSISLAQALMANGLIDEVRLVVCPVVLGDGRPFFADRAINLTLLASQSFDRGAVELAYRASS